MSRTSAQFNGDERAYAGVIVTFRERTTHQLRVEHRGGFAYVEHVRYKPERRVMGQEDVLRDLCVEADGWEGNWCVQTICTPSSILSDISPKAPNRQNDVYESTLLSRIDRVDMLWGAQSNTARNRNLRKGKTGG